MDIGVKLKASDEDVTIEKEVTQQDGDDDDNPLSELNDESKANLIKSLFYNIKDIELQARDKERKSMQAVIEKQRIEWENKMRSLQEEADHWKGEAATLLGAKSSKRSIKTSPPRKVLGNILPHSHPASPSKPSISQVSPGRYSSRPVSTLSITQATLSNTNTNITDIASPSASTSTSTSTSNHNPTPTSRSPASLKIELQTASKILKRLQHKYDALVAANAEIIAKRDKEREKWRKFKSTIKAALAERPDLGMVLERCSAEMIASQASEDTQVRQPSTSRKVFEYSAESTPKHPFSESKVQPALPANTNTAAASDGGILDYFNRPIALRTPERKKISLDTSGHSALPAPAPVLISPPPMIHGTLSTPSLSQEPSELLSGGARAAIHNGMQTINSCNGTSNQQEEAFIAEYEQFQFNEDMADMYHITECMSELQPYSYSRYASEDNAISMWTINGRKIKGPALGSLYDEDEHDQVDIWENNASTADTASRYGDNLLALAEEDGALDQILAEAEGEDDQPEQGLDISSRNSKDTSGLCPRQNPISQPTSTISNQPGGLLYIYPLPKELSAQPPSDNMDILEESLPFRRKHRSQGLFLDGHVVSQIVESSNTTSTVDVSSANKGELEQADQTLTSGANSRKSSQQEGNVIPPWLSQAGQEDSSDEATLPSSPMPGDNMNQPSPSVSELDREFIAKVHDDSYLPEEEAFRQTSVEGLHETTKEDTTASRKAAYAVSAYANEGLTSHSVRSISNEKLGPRKQNDKAFTVTTADRDSTAGAGPFLDAYIAKIENITETGSSVGNTKRRAVSATLREDSASSLPKNWHNMGKKRLSLPNRATSVDRGTPEPDITSEQRSGLVKQMLRTQFLNTQGGSQQDSPLAQTHVQGKKSRLSEGDSLSLGAAARLTARDTISASKVPRSRPKRKSDILQDPDVQADLDFVERAILTGKSVGALKKRRLADISISIEEAPRKKKRQALALDDDESEGGTSRASVRNTVKETTLLHSRADRRHPGPQDRALVKLERRIKSNNPLSTEKLFSYNKTLDDKTSDDSSEEFKGQAFMRELHRQRKKKLQEQQLARAAEASDASEVEIEGKRNVVPYKTTKRKKEDRKQMHGYDCDCCNGYYEYATRHLPVEDRREAARSLANGTSRHRQDYVPGKSPPGYWNFGFPTTQGVHEWNEEAKEMQNEKQASEKREATKCEGRFKYHAA